MTNKDSRKKINIANNIIENSKYEELLEKKFDSKLNLKAHVGNLSNKASRKMHALAKILSNMNFSKKKRIPLSAFLKSQFSYSRLLFV